VRLGGPKASVIAIQNEGDAACLLARNNLIASKRFGLRSTPSRKQRSPRGCAINCTVAAIGIHEARPFRSIRFQIIGVKMSCIASGILLPGHTIVFARDIKEFGIIDMR
jgi:hypothetical protein